MVFGGFLDPFFYGNAGGEPAGGRGGLRVLVLLVFGVVGGAVAAAGQERDQRRRRQGAEGVRLDAGADRHQVSGFVGCGAGFRGGFCGGTGLARASFEWLLEQRANVKCRMWLV